MVETRYYSISSEICSLSMYDYLKLKCSENIKTCKHIEKHKIKHLSYETLTLFVCFAITCLQLNELIVLVFYHSMYAAIETLLPSSSFEQKSA